MENKIIQYIEKILIENTSIDAWSDVYLPSIQDAYEEEYDKSIFSYFMNKIDQYNDDKKECILEVILSYHDPNNFYPVLEKFAHCRNKDIILTIITYLKDWALTENQKQSLNEFYTNSEAKSRFGDIMINELNKEK